MEGLGLGYFLLLAGICGKTFVIPFGSDVSWSLNTVFPIQPKILGVPLMSNVSIRIIDYVTKTMVNKNKSCYKICIICRSFLTH